MFIVGWERHLMASCSDAAGHHGRAKRGPSGSLAPVIERPEVHMILELRGDGDVGEAPRLLAPRFGGFP